MATQEGENILSDLPLPDSSVARAFGIILGIIGWSALASVFPNQLMPFPFETLGLAWGLVERGVAWSNLAAVDGDRLTVTEPFASGFEPDRPFTLTAPEGYGIASAAPDPSSSDEASATWEADTELEDFEVVVDRTNTDDDGADADDGSPDEGDTDDSPGFGVVAGSLALLAAALLAARKRQR